MSMQVVAIQQCLGGDIFVRRVLMNEHRKFVFYLAGPHGREYQKAESRSFHSSKSMAGGGRVGGQGWRLAVNWHFLEHQNRNPCVKQLYSCTRLTSGTQLTTTSAQSVFGKRHSAVVVRAARLDRYRPGSATRFSDNRAVSSAPLQGGVTGFKLKT